MSQEIWPQIISAASALSGFLVSQLATEVHEYYARKHQRKILLREKFEEMLFHFSTSLEYLVYLNGSTSQEAVYALAQCPDARKALNLCLLYFEDLIHPANDYVLSLRLYYECVIRAYDKTDSCTAGGQAAFKSPDDYNNALKNYFAKKDAFEHLIMSKVSKYTYA
jgi:hypothetical protein